LKYNAAWEILAVNNTKIKIIKGGQENQQNNYTRRDRKRARKKDGEGNAKSTKTLRRGSEEEG